MPLAAGAAACSASPAASRRSSSRTAAAASARRTPVVTAADADRRAARPRGRQARSRTRSRSADGPGRRFMSLFTTFGTFSIAAGILLIFLIFVMLAAERRGELGIARAVGTRRGHLVADVPLRGPRLRPARRGRRRARSASPSRYGMVLAMASAFGSLGDITISYAVKPASLVLAYAIGVLLTLVVVACLGVAREPDEHRRPRSATCPSRRAEKAPPPALVLGVVGLAARRRCSLVAGVEREGRDHARPRRLARDPQPRAAPRAARRARPRVAHRRRARARRLVRAPDRAAGSSAT